MGVAVLTLVGMHVLRTDLEVVVAVVRPIVWHELDQVTPEILECTVLPFIDQQRTGRVGTERDGNTLRDAGILDRPTEVVGEVQIGVSLRRGDGDGGRAR